MIKEYRKKKHNNINVLVQFSALRTDWWWSNPSWNMTKQLLHIYISRSAVHQLQERQGPDGDVRHVGAGQYSVQGVWLGREWISESVGCYAEVISKHHHVIGRQLFFCNSSNQKFWQQTLYTSTKKHISSIYNLSLE